MDRVHPQAACPPSDDRSLALFVDTCKTRRVRNAPRSGTSYHHFHEKDFSSDRRVALLAWAFVEFLLGPPFMVGIAMLTFLPTWPPSRVTLGVIAGVILLAGVGIGAWFWSDEQDRRATAAYVQAINQLSPSGPPLTAETRANAARSLETALARYPSAAMAPLGAYELGNVRFG